MRFPTLLLTCLLPLAAVSAPARADDPPADGEPTVAEALAEIAGDTGSAQPKLKELGGRRGERTRRVEADADADDAAAPARPRAATAPPADSPLIAQLQRVSELAKADDLAAAGRIVEQVIADPGFAALPEPARLYALTSAGWLASNREDFTTALGYYRRATTLASARADDWLLLSLVAGQADEPKEAAEAMTVMAIRWPQELADVETSSVYGVIADASHGSPERLALLQALADADYPNRTAGDAAFVWFELALERIERGELDTAGAAVAHITTPGELVTLRADRRFDAVVDRDAPAFDVERAARRRVDDLRARAYLDQDVLQTQVELTHAMLVVGEAENVLAMADEVEDNFAQSPQPGYRDDDQRSMMLNHRADALIQLGRLDEAEAALVAARAIEKQAGDDVTHALFLAVFQCANDQPAKALAAVEGLGGMSDFGRMVLSWVQVCAAIQQHDNAARDTALAWMREHHAESAYAWTDVLLMVGRDEEAAASVIARLRDPAQRGDMLVELQEFKESPDLPLDVRMRPRWEALEARADVRAALDEVGRRETYAIYRP